MFTTLKSQVQARFKELVESGKLFYIDIDRDEIWEKYLSGFTDPIERQGHNCNCCKSFIRQYGGIVTIIQNRVYSIWEIRPDDLFAPSIKAMREYVLSRPVTDVFMNSFAKLGTDKNVDSKDSSVVWNHFSLELPRQYVAKADSIASKQGELRDNKNVLKRSLDELTIDAVQTVLELIGQNSLYRGKEFESMLSKFLLLQQEYAEVPVMLRDNYAWTTSSIVPQAISRIRNTSIGTLLVDLSSGLDLDTAVTKFEKVVAPTNYKRPTALVTPKMVDDAKKALAELGYMESLERRFAMPADLNINNMLFVDKSSSLADVFEDMKKDTTVNPRTLSKTEEIGIDTFLADVLPHAKALYVLLENSHLANMVSMLTAVNGAPTLFKWGNPFSWAYSGGIADSIKERVKEAGGKVDGELRVSLSWHNYDDLDLHVLEPGGKWICYSNKINGSTGGKLDVDMNAGHGQTRKPVENIVWPTSSKMGEGVYTVSVHNFIQRETTDVGFSVQIECRGEVFDFDFPNNPRNGSHQTIVTFKYNRQQGITMDAGAKHSLAEKEKWGLKTNRFHKVKNVMLSPNCWEGIKGNKHHFFILENCASDEATRPFLNEYLKEDVAVHRKFFEVLGGKLLVSPTSSHLAGLGFSETQRNHMYVRVEGAFKRTLKINF